MVSAYLINNQYDQHASGETKVDFARKLDTLSNYKEMNHQVFFNSPPPCLLSVTLLIRFLPTSQKSRLYSTVSPSKLNKHVHIQRNSNGKMIQACSSVDDHKASPFQGCNLSLHRWPSSLLMQGSWVCFQGGCCKPPGVFIEGSKTRMEGWWQNRKFLPPGREARGKIWIPQSRF